MPEISLHKLQSLIQEAKTITKDLETASGEVFEPETMERLEAIRKEAVTMLNHIERLLK